MIYYHLQRAGWNQIFPLTASSYRRDRVGRLGGGVVVFVKDEINRVTRLDLQVGSVECIWLEIKINNKKYLYGTFNISPNIGQQIWEELEQSIYLALNSNHDSIITEPTYVTERSSSLLDLVFKIWFIPPFLLKCLYQVRVIAFAQFSRCWLILSAYILMSSNFPL